MFKFLTLDPWFNLIGKFDFLPHFTLEHTDLPHFTLTSLICPTLLCLVSYLPFCISFFSLIELEFRNQQKTNISLPSGDTRIKKKNHLFASLRACYGRGALSQLSAPTAVSCAHKWIIFKCMFLLNHSAEIIETFTDYLYICPTITGFFSYFSGKFEFSAKI